FAPESEDGGVAAGLAADGGPAVDADPELLPVFAVLEQGQAVIANGQRQVCDEQSPTAVGCAEAGSDDHFLANDLEVGDVLFAGDLLQRAGNLVGDRVLPRCRTHRQCYRIDEVDHHDGHAGIDISLDRRRIDSTTRELG